jgi:hypothetical protein
MFFGVVIAWVPTKNHLTIQSMGGGNLVGKTTKSTLEWGPVDIRFQRILERSLRSWRKNGFPGVCGEVLGPSSPPLGTSPQGRTCDNHKDTREYRAFPTTRLVSGRRKRIDPS